MSLEIISCKVCLLGTSAVGKSCIATRYTENKFQEDIQCTTFASFCKKVVDSDIGPVQLNIWDTAGQERFRALGKHFYKDAFIICLVYDITKKETFEDIKNIWYPDLQKYGEQYTVIALIGNKMDLYTNEEVSTIEAENYAKEIGAIFQLVSAKNGRGIDEIFEQLVIAYTEPEFSMKINKIKERKRGSFRFKKTSNKIKKKECCQL